MRSLSSVLLLTATLTAQTSEPLSREKLHALGAQLTADYLHSISLLDSAPVNAYLTNLGQRIAAQAPTSDKSYTFRLVDDDRTSLHAVVAFPDGSVFVPAQLIHAAATEDELAGMLAHAIAWIDTNPHAQTRPGLFLIADSCMSNGPLPLAFQPEQRQREIATDEIATRMLAQAGYDPWALLRYLERARDFPGRAARIAALQTSLPSVPAATYPAHPDFAAIQQQSDRLIPLPSRTPPRLSK